MNREDMTFRRFVIGFAIVEALIIAAFVISKLTS